MSKPVPKPRPPPKPVISALGNKPPLRPKPRRIPPSVPNKEIKTPPSIPNEDIENDNANITPPQRPFKPAHLNTSNTAETSNNTVTIFNNGQDTVIPQIYDDDLYDDVIVESDSKSDDIITNKPPPPNKPLPTLPAKTPDPQKAVKERLEVRPIPATRISPQSSPLHSPRGNNGPVSESGVDQEGATTLTDQNDKDDESYNALVKPVKKRIATRRQNPGKSTAEDIKRRPPPPPPEDGSSPKRGGSLKGPSIPHHQLTVSDGWAKARSPENIPKTAEEQSLYSYAYEHTFVPTPVKDLSDNAIVEEDTSYVEPDAEVVAGFMEELNKKNVCVSDGTYEIPEREIITEDSGDSGSDDKHDYEFPCDSPPPIPSRNKSGSYDFTSHDDWDDNEGDDEDEDEEHDYVEPPDAQGSSEGDETSEEEPLYQVYTARTLQRDRTLSRKRTDFGQTDIEDITKGTLRNMRMLWCELPEVVNSGILETIDANERKRQEAMFEVITSEASYLKSLKILENHFIKSPELTPGTPQSVIEKPQHHTLFSNVNVVVETSQRFLDMLRQQSSGSLVVSSISDIILEFASRYFDVYVKYCSNQIHQDRVFKDLRKSPHFVEGIERLEKSAAAQCLSLQSFLVLPMQRITRLPLLVDAICHRCEPGSDEFIKTDAALQAIHKVVRNCNEGARKMEQMEEMLALQPQIEFTCKPIALVSSNRWLLRCGEVVLVIEQLRSPISKKKLKLKPVYMFLFNDLLLITKKKGENRYRVLDYAYRNMTKVEESTDNTIQLDYLLSLILLENCNNKTKDFLLCAESETDKTRWLEAFNPPKAEREGEKVYGDWDCPQVQAIHNYMPQQPDELALHEGDVINVQRKLPDGWHYGERLCDGVCGWFPANYTESILNEHVRARNLLQRYRLLAASKHLIGAVQTMKTPKSSKLTLKSISSTLRDPKRDTIS